MIHNTGTKFYFASERQDDMGKWMNKMGLAAINYDASRDKTTSGFTRPEISSTSSAASSLARDGYSESEEEDDDVSRKWQGSVQSLESLSSIGSTNSPQQSPLVGGRLREVKETVGASTEELHAMLRSIQRQDLTIDGKDRGWQRRSRCTASNALTGVGDQAEIERLKKLHSLQRTLRAKEQELQEIDSLMSKPLTPTELHQFAEAHEMNANPK